MTKNEKKAVETYLKAIRTQTEENISQLERLIESGRISGEHNTDRANAKIDAYKDCIADINLKLDFIGAKR